MFRLDNFHIFYTDPSLFWDKIQGVDKIVSEDLQRIKRLGICRNDSYYRVEPDQIITSSWGMDIIASYKLEVEVNIASELSDEKIVDLLGRMKSIVLVPGNVDIPNDAENLADTRIKGLNQQTLTLLAPSTLRIKQDKKIGAREINPTVITLQKNDVSTDNLVKKLLTEIT